MQIKIGRWYWTREGLVAWVHKCSKFVDDYPFLGKHLWSDGEFGIVGLEQWTGDGKMYTDTPSHEWDLICEPASRERIVFPDPATCPRWYDVSKREQRESEEVLFT